MLQLVLIYFPAIIGLLIIGLFVLVNNPASFRNRIFLAFNVVGALWIFSQFLTDMATSQTVALWAFRMTLFFGMLAPLMFYYLALIYPTYKGKHVRRQIMFGVAYGAVALTSFTSLNVVQIQIIEHGVLPIQTGFLYDFSDLASVGVVVAAIIILYRKLRLSRSVVEKNQIRLMMGGISIVVIASIMSGIVLLRIFKTDSAGLLLDIYSIVIFSVILAYAMIKHRFFEVRPVASRAVAHLLSLVTLVGIYAGILFFAGRSIEGGNDSETLKSVLGFVAAVAVALTYNPIKKRFNKLTNKFFYQDAYEPQSLLNNLNSSLVTTVGVDGILKNTALLIEYYLKPSYIAFVVDSQNKKKVFSNGDISKSMIDNVTNLAARYPQGVTIGVDDARLTKVIYTESANLKVGLVARLQLQGGKDSQGFEGEIILGTKKSGSIYGSQDVKVMEIIADELVIAIQNALQFEEIQQFNITLQEKVDNATKQLRKANEKLIALDQSKDEFISMASHQLRTPLTSVKGYVSMVVEGDVGKITAAQKKLLDQAYLSSQRMVYLIADLLNVSRLKTGKFVIEAKPTNLADVVETELEQLKEAAASRKLSLEYEKPKDFPVLNLDETKIRQVIMNFADNAIYYTPSGGHIKVAVTDTGKSVEFTVTDDGIGVPKSEQHNLFNKFYRAGNAKKARPDGTGLGLFMAKKVVIAQGGNIIFKTAEGKGSTFGFSFEKKKLTAGIHTVETTDVQADKIVDKTGAAEAESTVSKVKKT